MTLYDHLIYTCQRCAQGEIPYEHISIDLTTRTIVCGDTLLMVHGVPTEDAPTQDLICFQGDPYREIEHLYAQYKHSVPSRQERLNKGYFKALSSDALTMEELENNLPRTEARIRLEAFICLAAAAGLLQWHVPRHFFWRGADPDCIVYRNWIQFEEEMLNEQAS